MHALVSTDKLYLAKHLFPTPPPSLPPSYVLEPLKGNDCMTSRSEYLLNSYYVTRVGGGGGVLTYTAPQHLVCRAVQSLHINRMQMSIIEVFICRRLHMNTSMILICIRLICRLCTALHTKCCGAVIHSAVKYTGVLQVRNFLIVQCQTEFSAM